MNKPDHQGETPAMNKQEALWAGPFGDDYQKRATGRTLNNMVLFERILRGGRADNIKSVLEIGAGAGENLLALHAIIPEARYAAVDVNAAALTALAHNANLAGIRHLSLSHGPALAFNPGDEQWDMVITKGFLIHQPPEALPELYGKLVRTAARYMVVAEYYSPTPVEVPYRGQTEALWKRDFAGEIMDLYPQMVLIDYGFTYRRARFPQDDVTWFLMERRR